MKIRFEGVCKSFGAQAVLRDVSLEVEFDHTLALVGPSGGGKSTLLRLIAGLEAADATVLTAPHPQSAEPGVRTHPASAAPKAGASASLPDAVRDNEVRIVSATLAACASRDEAARRLGISPRTLRHKLAQWRQQGLIAA